MSSGQMEWSGVAETGRSQGLTGHPALLKRLTYGSERDPVSNQWGGEWERERDMTFCVFSMFEYKNLHPHIYVHHKHISHI